jgi:hypothetical protein
MVRIAFPPPSPVAPPPAPLLYTLARGVPLVRIFTTAYGMTARTFRAYGPTARFDHHRGYPARPGYDPRHRGVYYAALSLEGCLVEVFGDSRIVDPQGYYVAQPLLTRDVTLLDLRGNGALRAGTVAAIAKADNVVVTQAWSRFFYKRSDIYSVIDGLVWLNAHNDDIAIMLYERAADALDCPDSRVMPLDDPLLRRALVRAAQRTNMKLEPG